jgi:hypothetical protein
MILINILYMFVHSCFKASCLFLFNIRFFNISYFYLHFIFYDNYFLYNLICRILSIKIVWFRLLDLHGSLSPVGRERGPLSDILVMESRRHAERDAEVIPLADDDGGDRSAEYFFASDPSAVIEHTNRFKYYIFFINIDFYKSCRYIYRSHK